MIDITALTAVSLHREKNRRRDRICFGHMVATRTSGLGKRSAFFNPGQVFCLVRWRRSTYGTTSWRFAVLKAGRAGQALQKYPGVTPGAHVLAHFRGVDRVRRALRHVRYLEKSVSDLSMISPAYWRIFQTSVLQRQSPRLPSNAQVRSAAIRVRCAP